MAADDEANAVDEEVLEDLEPSESEAQDVRGGIIINGKKGFKSP